MIEWQDVPMGELCSIQSGKSDTKDAVDGGAYVFFDRSKTIKRSSRYLRDCEALIIPGEGTEFLPRYFNGKFDLHQRAYALFDFSPKIDVKYLYHYLHHFSDYFPRVAVGATVKSLRLRHFEQLPVALTDLESQKRIVGFLDEAFDGIATAKANAEKNLENARALFESHLQSVFSRGGVDWVETMLENVLAEQPRNGWSPPAANHAASGCPVLTLSSVTGFQFCANKIKFTSARTDLRRRYWVRDGDFLLTRSNTPELVGHVAIASGITEPTIYPDLIMRMIPAPNRMLTKFLWYQMRTPALRREITGRAQGANPTMKKVGKSAVQTLPISAPPIRVQEKVVEQLDRLSEETLRLERTYQQKLAALDELKKSLLHQAFSGRL
jgi:type I restriction enzyme, S subunit